LDQLFIDGCVFPRAVQSRAWPGVASLEVAHVWVRRGSWQGDYFLEDHTVPGITSFLTPLGTVTGKPYRVKANERKSFQGSTVLGMGFVLDMEEAQRLIEKDACNKEVLFPYLNGEDLNSRCDQSSSRWVINFFDWPIERAKQYPDCFQIVEEKVKPEREANKYSKTAREKWWLYERTRPELYRTITGMQRVLVVSLVTHHVGLAFVPASQVFAHRLAVYPLDGSECLALLQSNFHEPWARAYSSSLETRINYSPTDCFETFPFPEELSSLSVIGRRYDTDRRQTMLAREEGLTKTYNRFHDPEETSADIQKLRQLHVEMDNAVAAAYGWTDLVLDHGFHETKQGVRYTISEPARREVLARLLKLNHERYAEEVEQGLHEKKKPRGSKRTNKAETDNG
jgi:hypothetical protein